MEEENKNDNLTPPDEQSPTKIQVQDNTIDEPSEPEPEEPKPEPTNEPAEEPKPEPEPEPEPKPEPEPTPEEPKTKPEPEPEFNPAENPDIITEAEAETPTEQAPVFPNETEAKAKPRKPLLIALITILTLAIGGASAWYFLLRDKGTEQPTSVSNNQQENLDLEPIEASKLALKGNDLSDFDLAFLRLENKQDNIIYSPLSIKYALAMLADGANGRSKEQITALIGDYTPKAYLNSTNRSLANAMFIRTDFANQVKDTYRTALESKYNASVILDPFTSPDNANKWVEDKTLGIIKDTFDSNTVNSELDYMLVNALAIDMKWNNQLQCAKAQEYVNGEWIDKGGVPCMDIGLNINTKNTLTASVTPKCMALLNIHSTKTTTPKPPKSAPASIAMTSSKSSAKPTFAKPSRPNMTNG